MSKYKVLLVDDEEDVRQSIAGKIKWAELGFQVVGEAANGQDALELAERLEPDVVMTDIKMPFMDGLELCRRVKKILPGVRLAIFSGFDEFEYAKEAISQQVDEYVLKPINASELTDVFKRLCRKLDEEIEARRDVEQLRHYYEESLPLMRQQLLVGLLENRTPAARLLEYGMDIAANAYIVAVVRLKAGDGENADGIHLLNMSLQQIIVEYLEKCTIGYELVQMPDQIAILFMLENVQESVQAFDLLDRIFSLARRSLGYHVSIGTGKVYGKPDQIHLSYAEATDALEYQLIMEPGHVIRIEDIEPGIGNDVQLETRFADEVIHQIKVGTKEDLDKAVYDLVWHLKGAEAGIEQYQIYMLELDTKLLQLIRTYRLDPRQAKQDALLMEIMELRTTSLDELAHRLLGFCENLREMTRRERKDSVRLMVDNAKNIIAERYTDNELSLDLVCANLNVSPAYFSTVFKKETGLGFVAYLTNMRMEKAVELLASTDEKTYQIAAKVGYADTNYFSYVFKRHFGLSPSKYRNDRLNK